MVYALKGLLKLLGVTPEGPRSNSGNSLYGMSQLHTPHLLLHTVAAINTLSTLVHTVINYFYYAFFQARVELVDGNGLDSPPN